MTACNSHKCHCPACLASRTDRLSEVEKRVATLELRESNRDTFAMAAARRAVLGTPTTLREDIKHPDNHVVVRGARVLRQTRTGKLYQGWDSIHTGAHPMLIWRWREFPLKPSWWRKFDERAGRFFGAPWRYPMTQFYRPIESPLHETSITFTDEKQVGDIRRANTITISNPSAPDLGWLRRHFAGDAVSSFEPAQFDTPVFSAGGLVGREHYAELRRKKPWKGGGDWMCGSWDTKVGYRRDHNGNMEYAMTPFMLEVLLHAHYSVEFFPRMHAPAYSESFQRLTNLGLIEVTSVRERIECKTHIIKTTPKGRVYVKALLDLPLPVQSEPQWSMPA